MGALSLITQIYCFVEEVLEFVQPSLGFGFAAFFYNRLQIARHGRHAPFGAYYSMLLTAGNHDVTCIAEGYQPKTVTNLPVVAGANKGYTFYLEPSTTENVTGISNPDETINRIYPNPATDQLTITGNPVTTVEILNQTGQRVLTVNEFSGDQTINIGNLSAGVYTVRFITNQGIETQKLIVR